MKKKDIAVSILFKRWKGRLPNEEELKYLYGQQVNYKRIHARVEAENRPLRTEEVYRLCELLEVTPAMLELDFKYSLTIEGGVFTFKIERYGTPYTVEGVLNEEGNNFMPCHGGKQLLVKKGAKYIGSFDLPLKDALSSYIYKLNREILKIEKGLTNGN